MLVARVLFFLLTPIYDDRSLDSLVDLTSNGRQILVAHAIEAGSVIPRELCLHLSQKPFLRILLPPYKVSFGGSFIRVLFAFNELPLKRF
jgi:hypothetical protein